MRTLSHEAITQLALDNATDAQLPNLGKMLKMGWKVTKVLGTRGKAEISLGVKGQGVWLKSDGTLVRPDAGRKCAKLR